MEIISEVGINVGPVIVGVLVVIFGLAVIGAYLMLKDDEENDSLKFFGAIMILCGVLLILAEVYSEKKFRLRVDDTTTVSELKETYKVVRYDPETDLWIVRKKEIKE